MKIINLLIQIFFQGPNAQVEGPVVGLSLLNNFYDKVKK